MIIINKVYREIRRGNQEMTIQRHMQYWAHKTQDEDHKKLEKKYAPAIDIYGQTCFVRSDFLKMKCVCETQMMPPPDNKKL